MKHSILFLGQKPIGEKCFEKLLTYYLENAIQLSVVTNESDDVWWKSNKIYKVCQQQGITVIPNEKRNTELIISCIKQNQVDVIISVQHRWILSETILKLVNYNAFNFHMAKLPEYRGYNPFTHAILNGEKKYAITCHKMTANVDSGLIFCQPSFEIEENDTAYSIWRKAEDLTLIGFEKLLSTIVADSPFELFEMKGKSHFYGKKEMYEIIEAVDPTDVMLDRIVRAAYFPPYKGASCVLNGKTYYLQPDSGQMDDHVKLSDFKNMI